MNRRSFIPLSIASLIAATGSVFAQGRGTPEPPGDKGDPWFKKKEKEPERTRRITGVVKDPKDSLVEGAVVRVKDVKTLEVRSFITLDDGSYRFYGLNLDNEYELKATHDGLESKTRRISVFNSQPELNIVLKLEPKA
jgi:hypothetical protein